MLHDELKRSRHNVHTLFDVNGMEVLCDELDEF